MIISIFNLKGGTGKSTTAVNLAACWSTKKTKVLLVDMDPQGSASKHLGARDSDGQALRDALVNGQALKEIILKTSSGVDLLAGGEWLTDVDPSTANKPLRELLLKRALAAIRDEYEFIIIDCPPSPGLLNISALLASDGVLIPVEAQGAAVDGLIQARGMIEIVDEAREVQGSQALIQYGVVVCKYDARTALSKDIDDALRTSFGALITKTIVNRNVKVAEAYLHCEPVTVFDPKSRGASDYKKLSKELKKRINNHGH